MTPVKSFAFLDRVAEFSTEIHSRPQPKSATPAHSKPLKPQRKRRHIDRNLPLYDDGFKKGSGLDEEKTVVGNVEKQLLGRANSGIEYMSEAEYERFMVYQAERSAARLRGRRGPASSQTALWPSERTDAPGTRKTGS